MRRRPGFTGNGDRRAAERFVADEVGTGLATPLPSGSRLWRRPSRHWFPRCVVLGYSVPAFSPGTLLNDTYVR